MVNDQLFQASLKMSIHFVFFHVVNISLSGWGFEIDPKTLKKTFINSPFVMKLIKINEVLI